MNTGYTVNFHDQRLRTLDPWILEWFISRRYPLRPYPIHRPQLSTSSIIAYIQIWRSLGRWSILYTANNPCIVLLYAILIVLETHTARSLMPFLPSPRALYSHRWKWNLCFFFFSFFFFFQSICSSLLVLTALYKFHHRSLVFFFFF